MTGKIKVLIVDDHAILRMGLTALLNSKYRTRSTPAHSAP